MLVVRRLACYRHPLRSTRLFPASVRLHQYNTLPPGVPVEKTRAVKQALSEFLSPEFTEAAVRMSKLYERFIWDLISESACEVARQSPRPYTQDRLELTSFLNLFFSDSLVQRLSRKMDALESSWLGSEYTMRFGKARIVHNVNEDLCMLPPFTTPGHLLYGFIGQDDEEEEYEEFVFEPACAVNCPVDVHARVPVASRRIQDLRIVRLKLDHWLPIASRSRAFMDLVTAWKHEIQEYDPRSSPAQTTCYLFYGVHDYQLETFQDYGVNARTLQTFGEFHCKRYAFYTSSSIRHAFEHTLHSHLATPIDKQVSVLAFEVDVAVLHGAAVPPLASRATPFVVKRFRGGGVDHKEWLEHCRGCSLDGHYSAQEECDIVIGPASIPSPDFSEAKEVSAAAGEEGVAITQVAFCSQDSIEWLNSCFREVYQEYHDSEINY